MNDTFEFDDFETQVQCEEYYPEETPLGEQIDGGGGFDEFDDLDATVWKEQQVFLDNEGY